MNSHERNYAAHEKETLAIMHALVKWRVYLEGRHFCNVSGNFESEEGSGKFECDEDDYITIESSNIIYILRQLY